MSIGSMNFVLNKLEGLMEIYVNIREIIMIIILISCLLPMSHIVFDSFELLAICSKDLDSILQDVSISSLTGLFWL